LGCVDLGRSSVDGSAGVLLTSPLLGTLLAPKQWLLEILSAKLHNLLRWQGWKEGCST
jgi:hypothetical protein